MTCLRPSLFTSYHASDYLFPSTSDVSALPNDLTQLAILITGAQDTAYAQGLWRLHLHMPDDYPKNPPKATFKTRIYHPNVDESSGAVCLDTLKKDWQSKLTLRDILVTISCLLIHPNPDSALNSAAGALLQEDYEAFAKQARLMASIHAPIPPDLKEAVLEARRRGEEKGPGQQHDGSEPAATSGASSIATSVVVKSQHQTRQANANKSSTATSSFASSPGNHAGDDDAKENDPGHSPSPVPVSHEGSRRHVLGKRPLSELPTPVDPDDASSSTVSLEERTPHGQLSAGDNGPSEPVRKSPKLDISAGNLNSCGKLRQEDRSIHIVNDPVMTSPSDDFGDDKENMGAVRKWAPQDVTKAATQQPVSQDSEHLQRPTLRKVSNVGSLRLKGQARVGIRRL